MTDSIHSSKLVWELPCSWNVMFKYIHFLYASYLKLSCVYAFLTFIKYHPISRDYPGITRPSINLKISISSEKSNILIVFRYLSNWLKHSANTYNTLYYPMDKGTSIFSFLSHLCHGVVEWTRKKKFQLPAKHNSTLDTTTPSPHNPEIRNFDILWACFIYLSA